MRRVAVAFAIGGATVGATALDGWSLLQAHPIAVVVEPEKLVRDDPRPEAPERFTLPAGTEVLVERRGWPFHLVRTGDGRQGYVSGASLVFVVP